MSSTVARAAVRRFAHTNPWRRPGSFAPAFLALCLIGCRDRDTTPQSVAPSRWPLRIVDLVKAAELTEEQRASLVVTMYGDSLDACYLLRLPATPATLAAIEKSIPRIEPSNIDPYFWANGVTRENFTPPDSPSLKWYCTPGRAVDVSEQTLVAYDEEKSVVSICCRWVF